MDDIIITALTIANITLSAAFITALIIIRRRAIQRQVGGEGSTQYQTGGTIYGVPNYPWPPSGYESAEAAADAAERILKRNGRHL